VIYHQHAYTQMPLVTFTAKCWSWCRRHRPRRWPKSGSWKFVS
jgi:hypothetical protein